MGFLGSIGNAIGGALGGIAGAVGNVVGGVLGNKSAENTAQMNYAAQKEFAQNGIRWKVADAKAAGIHPLAALGVNNASFSPSFTAGDYSWLGDAGQNVGRAIESKATRAERELGQAMQAETHAEQIRGLRLENDIRAQTLLQMKLDSLDAVKRTGRPPSMPGVDNTVLTGQGDSKYLEPDIKKYGFVRTPDGGRELVPSSDYAGLYEDKLGIEWLPFIEATLKDHFHGRFLGKDIGGFVWDNRRQSYVPRSEYRSGRSGVSGRVFPPGTMRGSYKTNGFDGARLPEFLDYRDLLKALSKAFRPGRGFR